MNQIINWVLYFSLASGSAVAAPVHHNVDIVINTNQNTITIPYLSHNISNPVYEISKRVDGNNVSHFYCKSKINKYIILVVSVYDEYVIACDPVHMVPYEVDGELTEVKDIAIFYRNRNAVIKLSKDEAIQSGAESARIFGWQ